MICLVVKKDFVRILSIKVRYFVYIEGNLASNCGLRMFNI